MARKIQLLRGNKINLPTLDIAEMALCTDTHEPFIGSNIGNIQLAKESDRLTDKAETASELSIANVNISANTYNLTKINDVAPELINGAWTSTTPANATVSTDASNNIVLTKINATSAFIHASLNKNIIKDKKYRLTITAKTTDTTTLKIFHFRNIASNLTYGAGIAFNLSTEFATTSVDIIASDTINADIVLSTSGLSVGEIVSIASISLKELIVNTVEDILQYGWETFTENFTNGISKLTHGDMPIIDPFNGWMKDPSVWRHENVWYMYCSASLDQGATYDTSWFTSPDGGNWDYRGFILIHGRAPYASRSAAATSKAILKDGVWHIWYDSQTDTEQTISHATCTDIANPVWVDDPANPIIPTYALDPFIVLENSLYYMFYTYGHGVEQIRYKTSSDLYTWSTSTDIVGVFGEGPVVVKAPNGKWRIITAKALASSLTSEDLDTWESDTLTSGYVSTGKIKMPLSSFSGVCYGHCDIVVMSPGLEYRLFYNSTWVGPSKMVVSMAKSSDMYNFYPFNFADYPWAQFWNLSVDGEVTYDGVVTTPGWIPFIRRWEFFSDFDLSVDIRFSVATSSGGILLFGKQSTYQHMYQCYLNRSTNLAKLSICDTSGTPTLLAQSPTTTFALGEWHTIRLRRIGTTFTWWINGLAMPSITNEAPLLESVALALYSGKQNMSFRNISISGKVDRL